MAKLYRISLSKNPVPGRDPWLLDYYDLNGKRHRLRYKTRDEGKLVKDRVSWELREETHTPSGDSVTLERGIEAYCDDLAVAARQAKGGTPSKGYARVEEGVLKLVPDHLRAMKMSEFKHSDDIKKAIMALGKSIPTKTARRRAAAYGEGTMKRVKDALSRVFTFGMHPARGYCRRNVIREFKFLTGRVRGREREATDREGALLLQAAQKYKSLHPKGQLLAALNVYALEYLIILCGVRPEEACALHVKSIERLDPPPDDPTATAAWIHIKERITRDDGLVPGTKDGAPRWVAVDGFGVAAIDEIERYYQAQRWAKASGHKIYTPGAISERTHRYFYGADAPRRWKPETSIRRSTYVVPPDEPLERRQDGRVFLGKEGTMYTSHSLAKKVNALMLQAGIVKRDDEGNALLFDIDTKNGKKQVKKAGSSNYHYRHKVCGDNSELLPTNVGAADTGHSPQTFLRYANKRRPAHSEQRAQAMSVRSRRLKAEMEKLAAEEKAEPERLIADEQFGTGSAQRRLTHSK